MPDRSHATPFGPYRVTESGLLLRDTTIADVTTARHGLTPKLPGDSSKYLDGSGNYSSPGGASGTGVIAPAGPKVTPNDANFSWLNQGSSTVTVSSRDGSIFLFSPNDTADSIKGRMFTPMATPYTYIFSLVALHRVVNFWMFGTFFHATGANKVISHCILSNGGTLQQAIALSSSSFDTSGTSYLTGSLFKAPLFLALRDDGTNKSYWLGEDEEHLIKMFEHTRTTGITPDRVGFFVNPRNASSLAAGVTLLSLRQQSGVPG